MAVCPECESAVDIDDADVEIGDEMSCAECGTLLRVAQDTPVELEAVDEDEDEDEDPAAVDADDKDEDEESEDEDTDEMGDEKED